MQSHISTPSAHLTPTYLPQCCHARTHRAAGGNYLLTPAQCAQHFLCVCLCLCVCVCACMRVCAFTLVLCKRELLTHAMIPKQVMDDRMCMQLSGECRRWVQSTHFYGCGVMISGRRGPPTPLPILVSSKGPQHPICHRHAIPLTFPRWFTGIPRILHTNWWWWWWWWWCDVWWCDGVMV